MDKWPVEHCLLLPDGEEFVERCLLLPDGREFMDDDIPAGLLPKVEKALFSPVGLSDPMRDGRDGPLLHIARHKLPDLIVLFYTKEISQKHREDNRYCLFIRDLYRYKGKPVMIEVIHSEIDNPHLFDKFGRFREFITRIHTEHKDAEILLNMTSGTPQMTAQLCIEAATMLIPKICSLQVPTHRNKSNAGVSHDFSMEELKRIREEDTLKPRWESVNIKSQTKALVRQTLIDHIEAHDYAAALRTLTGNDFFEEMREPLNAANDRWNMKLEGLPEDGSIPECFLPAKKNRNLLEYYLHMCKQLERDDVNEGLLMISAFGYDLAKTYLLDKMRIDISDFTRTERGIQRIDGQKVYAYSPSVYNELGLQDSRNDPFLSLRVVLPFLQEGNMRERNVYFRDIRKFESIRDIEEKVRNRIAHQMIRVTRASLERNYGIRLADVLKNCKDLMSTLGFEERHFGSYEEMNQWLLDKVRA